MFHRFVLGFFFFVIKELLGLLDLLVAQIRFVKLLIFFINFLIVFYIWNKYLLLIILHFLFYFMKSILKSNVFIIIIHTHHKYCRLKKIIKINVFEYCLIKLIKKLNTLIVIFTLFFNKSLKYYWNIKKIHKINICHY